MPPAERKDLLRKAIRFAEQLQEPEALFKLSQQLANLCKAEGDYKRAALFYEKGWSFARATGEQSLVRKAALLGTDFLLWQGHISMAIERYEEVIGNLEEFATDEPTLLASAILGWCYGICAQTARGMGFLDAIREKAKEYSLGRVKVYADLMTVLLLIEARRVSEAEPFLERILNSPPDQLSLHILWAAHAAKAFVMFWHGDLDTCYEYQKKAYENSKRIGSPYHRGPWNFEYLEALEEKGLVHPQMNYDAEIRRMLKWPDIYMKGVALRYKAKKTLKLGGSVKRVMQDLDASLRLLKRAGAKLEQARTELMMARLLLKEGRARKAERLIRNAHKVLSKVNENLFPEDLLSYLEGENKEDLLIKTVADIGVAIGTIRNQSQLLQKIVNVAMRLTRAERGAFFSAGADHGINLAASRNLDPASIASGDFDIKVVREVSNSGKELYVEDMSKRPVNKNKKSTGWMMCFPVALKGKILGVLYLDCNIIAFPFPKKEIPLLRAISNQVAVALDNVRAYEEIARLRERLEEETRIYRMELESTSQVGEIIGESQALRSLRGQIERVAPTDSSVLITGETGVGKGLVARAIHRLSARSNGPFIPVNISSLSPGLVASEFFGHDRGAFTGAIQRRLGRFELADGGTVFLDDVDSLPTDIQARLLRCLQDKEFERVGGSKTIKSDFRVISATNQDLKYMVDSGRFRSDLYYRLNVFPIHIPPLRERKEDIPVLALHFADVFSTKMGKDTPQIPESQMKRLVGCSWPGNVRELRHIIERAVILAQDNILRFPDLMEQTSIPEGASRGFVSLQEMERDYIIKVLQACRWKVSGKGGAAEVLSLKPTTLYSKMRRLGIKRTIGYRAA